LGAELTNPFVGWTMLGNFCIYLVATRPRAVELTATLCVTAAVYLGCHSWFGVGYSSSQAGMLLGGSAILMLSVRLWLRRKTGRESLCRQSLAAMAIFSYLGICLGFFISLITLAAPLKFDYYLFRFDGSLGFQPSAFLGKPFWQIAPFYLLGKHIYQSIGLWTGLVYAIHLRSGSGSPAFALKVLLINPIGCALYFVFPAMGPRYAFPTFPVLPVTSSVHPMVIAATGIPNCMPSLHLATALLLFWLSRPWRWLRIMTGLFLFGTLLVILGSGEHYLVDAVVAVPYALAILGLAARSSERWPQVMISAFVVLLWLVLLHSAYFVPLVSWGMVATTAGIGFWGEHRLSASLMRERQERAGSQNVADDALCPVGQSSPGFDAVNS